MHEVFLQDATISTDGRIDVTYLFDIVSAKGSFTDTTLSAAGCAERPAETLWGGILSWTASAHVKPLTHHKDGTKLSAREKLILFVLADSHNESLGNCAWISVSKAAEASLTSERRFQELLGRLEKHGTLTIERREGRTNRYFFPDLPPQFSRGSKGHPRNSDGVPPQQLPHPTPATATAPEPLMNLQKEEPSAPSARSFIDLVNQAIQESHRTGQSADEILKRLKAA